MARLLRENVFDVLKSSAPQLVLPLGTACEAHQTVLPPKQSSTDLSAHEAHRIMDNPKPHCRLRQEVELKTEKGETHKAVCRTIAHEAGCLPEYWTALKHNPIRRILQQARNMRSPL